MARRLSGHANGAAHGLIIGPMLYIMYGGSLVINILTVAGGELVACYALGLPLIRALEKTPGLYR